MDLLIFHPTAFHRLASTKPFPDSKSLVDLVLKPHLKPEAVLKRVEALGPVRQDTAEERRAIQALLDDCFDPPGTELSLAPLPGFDASGPPFLHSLESPYPSEVRAFALHVHSLWPYLCRAAQQPAATSAEGARPSPFPAENAALAEPHLGSIPPDSFAPSSGTTFLSVAHPVIVPGDRFREVYYWDSYWIIRGLLRSGLPGTAEGMVRNFLGAVRRFGFVPNGGRSYYLNRSQPPLLSQMVKEVAEALNAPRRQALLEEALPALLLEHQYWTSGPKLLRLSLPPSAPQMNGTGIAELSRHYANWDRPRPESYMEDYDLAGRVAGVSDEPGCSGAAAQQDRRRSRLWQDVASAAESGWDFSTRWFEDGRRLETIRTTGVVPADLNGFLFQLERNIAGFAQELKDPVLASDFEGRAARRRHAMNTLMWDPEGGIWRDLWLDRDAEAETAAEQSILISSSEYWQHKGGTFASSFVPLWCGLASSDPPHFAAAVTGLERSGLIQPGGLVTAAAPGDPAQPQQWDYPNGWAPLQSMIVDALCSGGEASAQEKGLALARRIACGWLNSCREGLRASGGFLAEKYDVVSGGGLAGGGGEYAPQVGFGWTNGVVLDFLARKELWGWDGEKFRP